MSIVAACCRTCASGTHHLWNSYRDSGLDPGPPLYHIPCPQDPSPLELISRLRSIPDLHFTTFPAPRTHHLWNLYRDSGLDPGPPLYHIPCPQDPSPLELISRLRSRSRASTVPHSLPPGSIIYDLLLGLFLSGFPIKIVCLFLVYVLLSSIIWLWNL
jgi:hypothetical protein